MTSEGCTGNQFSEGLVAAENAFSTIHSTNRGPGRYHFRSSKTNFVQNNV